MSSDNYKYSPFSSYNNEYNFDNDSYYEDNDTYYDNDDWYSEEDEYRRGEDPTVNFLRERWGMYDCD